MVLFKEKQKLKKNSFIIFSIVASLSYSIFLFTLFQYVEVIDFIITNKLNYILLRISAMTSTYFSYMLVTGYFLQLETEVTDVGISYKLTPFISKMRHVQKDLVQSFEVLDDPSFKRYGGWDIRRIFAKMKDIYIITGSTCVRVILINGEKIILGTQKPETLIKGLERMKRRKLKKNG